MVTDIEKLLGGYAAGTLTKEEREALFQTALDDQQLFDALANEEALKELLEDPESRQRLLDVLGASPAFAHPGRLTLLMEWFRKPFNLTLAGSIATAAVAVFVFGNLVRDRPQEVATPRVSETTEESLQDRSTLPDPRQEPTPAPPIERASLPTKPPSPPAFDAKLSHRVAEAPMDSPQMSHQAGAPMAKFRDSRQSTRTKYTLSLRQPLAEGPAQRLFYAPANRESQRERAARPTAMRRSAKKAKRSQQLAAENIVPTPSGFAKLQSTTTDSPRIGLRLSLEKEGPDGSYSGIKLDALFDQKDKLRLIVVANTDGYLYSVATVDGNSRRLFPSLGDSGGGSTDAEIRKGERVTIPLLEASRPAPATGEYQLRVILSRTVLPELATKPTTIDRDETRLRESKDSLNMLPSANEQTPVIREEQTDHTNYFVPSTASIAPLVIELKVTRF